MASPIKKSSNATVTTMVTPRPGKTFIDEKAKQHFLSDFCHRQFSVPCTVDFDFFITVGINTFQMFEKVGWGPFFTINELVYPEIVKEFYANLEFNDTEGISMIKERRVNITAEFIADMIDGLMKV